MSIMIKSWTNWWFRLW